MSLSRLDLRSRYCCGLLVAVLLTVGCNQHDQITSYTVRKPELVDPTLLTQARSVSEGPKAPTTEQQTLGLIVPVGDKSWFFKVTGDPEAVAANEQPILDFLVTVKFSGGPDPTPSWSLPAGWQELPGGQFRFATIRVPGKSSGEKSLDISVSAAGGELLANINRWRGQLNLKPIAAADLPSSSKTLKIDGHAATLVNIVGKGNGQMPGAPFAPFAGGSGTLPPDHPPIPDEKNQKPN